MTTPQRLLDGDGDDFELALLASARGDEPSRTAAARTLLALGLGAGVATAATAATGAAAQAGSLATALSPATTAAGTASAATTAAATVGKAGLPMLVKWVGIATVGGLGTWGVVEEVRTHQAPAPVIAAAVAPAAQHVGESGARARTQQRRTETERVAVVPVDDVAAAEAPAPSAAAPTASARASAPTLADEIAALDSARMKIQSDPNAALAALAAYDSRFPRGALGQEASVTRIEALAAAGRHDQARARANAFIAAHPNSPYAQRLRSVLGE